LGVPTTGGDIGREGRNGTGEEKEGVSFIGILGNFPIKKDA